MATRHRVRGVAEGACSIRPIVAIRTTFGVGPGESGTPRPVEGAEELEPYLPKLGGASRCEPLEPWSSACDSSTMMRPKSSSS
jgi:hypothetical protein